MKRIVALTASVLTLAGCQDTPEPTAITSDVPEASFSRTDNTVDVIVSLKSGFAPGAHAANAAAAAQIARGLGVSPRFAYGSALFGFAASVPEGRLNALRHDPRVAYVDFDAPVSVPMPRIAARPGSGGSTGETIPWGIKRIGADVNSNEGAGIHVFIIDTGIDSDHADLQGNIDTNGFAAETCKGGGCQYSWDDDHGHGTHVAGTVGAIQGNNTDVVGVASQVKLHGVKVLSKSGSGTRSGVIAGVDFVASQTQYGARVANMSLGGSGSKTGSCTDSGFTGTDTYHEAMCNAKNAGVVFAVAAGNDGADAEASVPAAYDDAVITVSATNSSDDWTSWSNWGDNSASWTAHGSAPVAIAAPGASILSTKVGGGTTTMSGTSMASPHAAGAIALFLKSNPQSANGTAFSNIRAGLMSADESTDTWTNTSGNVHDEDFLKAGSL